MQHVAQSMAVVQQAMYQWFQELVQEAGLSAPVRSSVGPMSATPELVLMPYQTLLESQSQTPTKSLVPNIDARAVASITSPWAKAGMAMSQYLLEHYPKRPSKDPGLGPLHPAPKLSDLAPSVAAWYEAQGEPFLLGKGRGMLPSVSWRHPFSFVVRFIAVVPACEDREQLESQRLMLLSVVGAAIRHRRFFETMVPAVPYPAPLSDLLGAMAEGCEGELSETLRAYHEAVANPYRYSAGIYPHHELTDLDLANVMWSLKQPMQPAVVFALRLSLGAGPEMQTGAIPEVSSAERLGDR